LYISNVIETTLSAQPSKPDNIECPLCLGAGELTRSEILDRLGVRDFARVAQLSAEEAFRLLQSQYRQDGELLWSRFESELVKRTSEAEHRYKNELHVLNARTKDMDSTNENTDNGTDSHYRCLVCLRSLLDLGDE
jgi:hypothetical protein